MAATPAGSSGLAEVDDSSSSPHQAWEIWESYCRRWRCVGNPPGPKKAQPQPPAAAQVCLLRQRSTKGSWRDWTVHHRTRYPDRRKWGETSEEGG